MSQAAGEDALRRFVEQIVNDVLRWGQLLPQFRDPAVQSQVRNSPSYAPLLERLQARQTVPWPPPVGLVAAALIYEIQDEPAFELGVAVLNQPLGLPLFSCLQVHVGQRMSVRLPAHADPLALTFFHLTFGNAYAQHPHGSRNDNLERALDCYQQAEQTCQLVTASRWRAYFEERIHTGLGNVYMERIWTRAPSHRYELAIEHYQRALRLVDAAYRQGWLEETEFLDAQGRITNNLGNASRDRPLRANETKAQKLDEALAWFRQSHTARGNTPLAQAETLRNMATTWQSAAGDGRPANLERSLNCCRQALRIYEQEQSAAQANHRPNAAAQWQSLTHLLLGIAYTRRRQESRADNFQRAHSHFREADRRYRELGLLRELIFVHYDWGRLCQEQGDTVGAYRHLSDAAERTEKELDTCDNEVARTAILNFYGCVYEDLIACCAQLATKPGRPAPHGPDYAASAAYWAERSRARNLGGWMRLAGRAEPTADAAGTAPKSYRKLLWELRDLNEELARSEGRGETDWQEPRGAVSQDAPLAEPAPPPAPRRIPPGDFGPQSARLPPASAVVPTRHLGQLRAKREQLLQELRSHGERDALHETAMEADEFQSLAVAANAALLSLRITPAGVCGILIPPTGPIETRLLDRLPRTELERLLLFWLAEYEVFRQSAQPAGGGSAEAAAPRWSNAINRVCRELGGHWGRELVAWLKPSRGGEPTSLGQRPVVVLPGPGLNLLPLQALCWQESSQFRYLADEFLVSFAPSFRVLERCLERQRQCPPRLDRALIVANPTGGGRTSIPMFSLLGRELLQVLGVENARLLGPSLRGQIDPRHWATHDRLTGLQCLGGPAMRGKGELEKWPITVLATHGSYDHRDPWRGSAVQVADAGLAHGPAQVSLADFLQLDLTRSWLTVLCACESARSDDRDLTSELTGLPAALLAAGAITAVGSLWPVETRGAAWLIRRFLVILLGSAETVPGGKARALAQAADDLRRLTRDEFNAWFTGLPGSPAPLPAEYGELPFADPYYWAPFVCYGAV